MIGVEERDWMLITERQSKIAELIQKEGSVQVETLADQLGVSAMTIRRDLEKLDYAGIVERCYGGAVAKKEVIYAEKQVHNKREKEVLAKRALQFIKDRAVIFLDAGTTIYEIARLVMDMKDLLVVTNDLEIAQLLKNGEPEVMLCGGYIQKSTGSMLGNYAMNMIADFRFDIGFFGAATIDEEMQVLTPTIDKAFFKKQTVSQCQESYLVVDESKFAKKAMIRINQLSDYTGVITNHYLTETGRANIIHVPTKE